MNKWIQVFAFIQHVDAPVHVGTFCVEEDKIKDWENAQHGRDLVAYQISLMRRWMFYDLTAANCTVLFFESMPNISRYYTITKSGMLSENDEAFCTM